MKNIIKVIILGTFSSIASFSVCASNCNFMGNSAMTYFTKEDIHMFQVAQNNALNNGKDGTTIAWKNNETGSHGYFIPSRSTQKDGVSCRQVKMFNSAHLVDGKATFKFCKLKDKWRIV